MTYNESLLLTGQQWNNLDENKKLEVLQTIENHIAFESGRLSCPVEGKFLYTGIDGIVLGTYDPASRRIYVNSSQLDSESMYGKHSDTLVTTCLHEGRHAYQHQVAEGIVHHDNSIEVETWRENLKTGNYISYRENPRAYYDQPVEVDARTFAAGRYKELICERKNLEIDNSVDYNQARKTFETQINNQSSNDGFAADYKLVTSADLRFEIAEDTNKSIHV